MQRRKSAIAAIIGNDDYFARGRGIYNFPCRVTSDGHRAIRVSLDTKKKRSTRINTSVQFLIATASYPLEKPRKQFSTLCLCIFFFFNGCCDEVLYNVARDFIFMKEKFIYSFLYLTFIHVVYTLCDISARFSGSWRSMLILAL